MSGIEIGNLESLHTLVFSSLEFLFRYLPLFLILFYAVPKRFRMFVLFAFSLILYALGDPAHVLILLGMSVVNWLFGYGLATEPDADGKRMSGLHRKNGHPGVRGLRRKTINWSELQLFEETVDQRKEEPYRNTGSPQTVKKRKFWLAVSVLCNASLLIFFKLSNVFEENMLLPVGISFYTFKSISYLIDVYRSGHAERSFLRFGAYLCCFPQIVSGPIMRYGEMEQAQQFGVWKAARAEDGLKYIIAGLGMKVLLADRLGFLWNDIQTIGFESISTPLAWLGAAAYSMELYFDFAGYSLIAVGIGRMIGLPAIKNFDQPYSSRSVSEFYRRWHMTLGSWFRDYLYIPLGGNRKGTLRTVFNLLLVWAVTGFWHGGGLHFILWGMILGLLVVIEKLWIGKWLKKSKILSHVYVLFVIPLTWMVFAIPTLPEIGVYFARLFPFFGVGSAVNPGDFAKELTLFIPELVGGILLCIPQVYRWCEKHRKNVIVVAALFAVFWYSVYRMANAANNPFMYANF